CQQFNSATPTF
nr:immunoglobulin light chain junction region [Macaca mulatta]